MKRWTDPELVKLWWGPEHFTSPRCEIDLREGGKYLFCMRAPENFGGWDSYSTGTYTRIVPLKRLEFTQTLSDPNGNPIHPSQAGLPPDFPEEVRYEIEFRALSADRTELTITEYGWTNVGGQMYNFAEMGMKQSLDKFAANL